MNAYQFWIDSLAGRNPAIVNEEPKPGFYRMKMRGKNGTWVPVAVWPLGGTRLLDAGLGFKFGRETVSADKGTEAWPYYAANPITEDTYRAVAESGENWPDADPVVAALTAKPKASRDPEQEAQTEQAFIAADDARNANPVTEIKEEITAALGGVASYAKIETEEANTRAAGLRNMLMKLSGDADKDGKALYEPHYRKYKEIYDQWNPLVKLAADGALKLRRAMEGYQDDKRAAAREAQRRADAEQRRLEKEASDAAIQAQIDGQPSPEPVEIAPVIVESNMPPPDAQVRPTFGKAANVGTHEVVTAINAELVFTSFKAHPKVIALLTELAQASINAGIIIPGATHETRSKIR